MDYKPNATERHATAQNTHARGEHNALNAIPTNAQTAAITIAQATTHATANPAPKAVR